MTPETEYLIRCFYARKESRRRHLASGTYFTEYREYIPTWRDAKLWCKNAGMIR